MNHLENFFKINAGFKPLPHLRPAGHSVGLIYTGRHRMQRPSIPTIWAPFAAKCFHGGSIGTYEGAGRLTGSRRARACAWSIPAECKQSGHSSNLHDAATRFESAFGITRVFPDWIQKKIWRRQDRSTVVAHYIELDNMLWERFFKKSEFSSEF